MNDLISRKLAIEALGEEPMVWNDDDAFALGERNQWKCDVEAIKGVPSVEPEIIRCKDCKNFKRNIPCVGGVYDGCGELIDEGSEMPVDENFYCGYAKRRTDEQ